MTGRAVVLRGDAAHLPLPDASVDLIVTSPPYFGLRSYTDTVKCLKCIDLERDGRDPRQAWPDYEAHVRRDHTQHYGGQIGSEATPREYIAALLDCTREWVRVLKPSGSLFVNLGDKYAGGGGFAPNAPSNQGKPRRNLAPRDVSGFAQKTLLGLPWRYALGCIDDLGLILRAEIVWAKPNGLPESVTDRVRRSHEQVFHFTRQPRYFAAVDEVREERAWTREVDPKWAAAREATAERRGAGHRNGLSGGFTNPPNPLGKLPGSVWEIPSQPLTVPAALGIDHFAAFPMELPRRIILGWSPSGICTACGEGRRPAREVDWSRVPHQMTEKRVLTDAERARFAELFREWQQTLGLTGREIAALFPSQTGGMTGCVANWRAGYNVLTPEQAQAIEAMFGPLPDELMTLVNLTRLVPVADIQDGSGNLLTGRHNRRAKSMSFGEYGTITGYACACPDATAPTRPATVLDPFGGTGTTALVASVHGRTGITIDRSADYCRLAAWRTTDPAERARALGVPKPPPVPDGQASLFDLEAS